MTAPSFLRRVRELLAQGMGAGPEAERTVEALGRVLQRRGLHLRELSGDARFTCVVARECLRAEVSDCAALHRHLQDALAAAWEQDQRVVQPVLAEAARLLGGSVRLHGGSQGALMAEMIMALMGGMLLARRPTAPEDRDAFMVGCAQGAYQAVVEARARDGLRPRPQVAETAKPRQEAQRGSYAAAAAHAGADAVAPAEDALSPEARAAHERRRRAQEAAVQAGRQAGSRALRPRALLWRLRPMLPALPPHVEEDSAPHADPA